MNQLKHPRCDVIPVNSCYHNVILSIYAEFVEFPSVPPATTVEAELIDTEFARQLQEDKLF
jgi:hypothetical protein